MNLKTEINSSFRTWPISQLYYLVVLSNRKKSLYSLKLVNKLFLEIGCFGINVRHSDVDFAALYKQRCGKWTNHNFLKESIFQTDKMHKVGFLLISTKKNAISEVLLVQFSG